MPELVNDIEMVVFQFFPNTDLLLCQNATQRKKTLIFTIAAHFVRLILNEKKECLKMYTVTRSKEISFWKCSEKLKLTYLNYFTLTFTELFAQR